MKDFMYVEGRVHLEKGYYSRSVLLLPVKRAKRNRRLEQCFLSQLAPPCQ